MIYVILVIRHLAEHPESACPEPVEEILDKPACRQAGQNDEGKIFISDENLPALS